MTGEPAVSGDQPMPANRSGLLWPNALARCRCSADRTLAQKNCARSILGQVVDVRAGQKSTSGGSSDSAANGWQENPAGWPASIAVMTVIPGQKCPDRK